MKRIIAVVLAGVALAAGILAIDPSRELIVLVLIISTAPFLTLFPFLFAWFSRGVWWRMSAGRAIMISTTSLAALVDLALAHRVFGDYPYRQELIVIVFAGICAGAHLKFWALITESYKGRRDKASRAETLTTSPTHGEQ